mmetsp:Transcript_45764/g.83839  ORF Transcript_45764/g.83839 Transcript_45764/m.83839 type:complete len:228 (+) Transcript_45764:511-1194(+)
MWARASCISVSIRERSAESTRPFIFVSKMLSSFVPAVTSAIRRSQVLARIRFLRTCHGASLLTAWYIAHFKQTRLLARRASTSSKGMYAMTPAKWGASNRQKRELPSSVDTRAICLLSCSSSPLSGASAWQIIPPFDTASDAPFDTASANGPSVPDKQRSSSNLMCNGQLPSSMISHRSCLGTSVSSEVETDSALGGSCTSPSVLQEHILYLHRLAQHSCISWSPTS